MFDKDYMNRCLELARIGRNHVFPNPMVGAVIVFQNQIIGEGYHQQYGGPHAEVNAINQIKDKSLLKKATLYVSLEPCNHFGKTPPCSDLIIESKIPNVVIGCIDPFDRVAGKGVEKLQKAGVKVKVGVLEEACIHLNRRFFTFHAKKRPYIVLKWAQTKDGYLDKERTSNTPKINWISQKETKLLTHSWRAEEAGILVGKNTILNDNPSLTTREVKGKNPIRIVLDRNLEIPLNSNVFSNETLTIVVNEVKDEQNEFLHYRKINFANWEKELMQLIHSYSILSIIVEGGANTLQHFIATNLWDEARVITGNTYFEKGLQAPKLNQKPKTSFFYGEDEISIYFHD